jgi:hypothetical protein
MNKTAGITILAASLLLLLATGQTNNGREVTRDDTTPAPGVLRFGDIPQETPMYTAWGVDVCIKGVVDTAAAASNLAHQAYVNTSNVYDFVEGAAESAAIAQSNAVLAANVASAAMDVALWCSNALAHVVGEKKVALFILPINPQSSTDGRLFSGFELKATTNNFLHVTSASDLVSGRMVFWCASSHINEEKTGLPHGWPNRSWDNMWIFSCDYNVPDERAWTKWKEISDSGNGNVSLTQVNNRYPRYVAVIVCKEMLHRENHEYDDGWLSSENEELLWSYVRTTDGELERDSSNHPIWTVCQPIKWLTSVPEWAEGGVE